MKHRTSNIERRTSKPKRPKYLTVVQRWMLNVECWMFFASFLLAAGCPRFHPQPISPDKTAAAFDTRSLTNANLQAFLEKNHVTRPLPRPSWDLDALTL